MSGRGSMRPEALCSIPGNTQFRCNKNGAEEVKSEDNIVAKKKKKQFGSFLEMRSKEKDYLQGD